MAAPQIRSIGIILGSTREPRVNPQITAFVNETLQQWKASKSVEVETHLIDLADWNLPFLDEPRPPVQVHHESEYAHEHTRAWSREIQKHSAFIFVTPQYNWSVPAVLKNALDFLFFEWTKKPGMIVSYGGHGGGKSAGHLMDIMGGLRMTPVETKPALAFPSSEILGEAMRGEDIHATGPSSIWESKIGDLQQGFAELLSLMDKS